MNPIFVVFGLGFAPSDNYSALHWCLCTFTSAKAISASRFSELCCKGTAFVVYRKGQVSPVEDTCHKDAFKRIIS